MKYLFSTLLLFIIMFNAAGQSQLSSDSTKIIAMIGDWDKAWQIKDPVLAAKWYSCDARFTNAFGDKKKGQEQIRVLLTEVFSLPFVMAGQSETTKHDFQLLDKEQVLVHSDVVRKGQQLPDGSLLPDRQTTHLRVFKKTAKGWQIVAHLISDAKDKGSVRR
ncbi:MAG: hypothetical protein EOP48_31850 [Sphingobacteriales bacterium]|nr:MAG: hypothetical protein EOP48_31850 [Sphingobacteriales bacterium]